MGCGSKCRCKPKIGAVAHNEENMKLIINYKSQSFWMSKFSPQVRQFLAPKIINMDFACGIQKMQPLEAVQNKSL